MTEGESVQSTLGTSGVTSAEPSSFSALPFFIPVAIFPLLIAATWYGNWWLAGPFIFLWLADSFDTAFGKDERNFNPQQLGNPLFWHKMAVWIWVALYPICFVFAFWQIFRSDQLALWEDVLIVLSVGAIARLALNAGHDMMHRSTVWERRVGELLMASVSFPQEVTEHIYVHHAYIGTPKDAVSAPKGQSFWQYLPRSVFRSYLDTWRVEKHRMSRRRLTVWHYSNPVWRYILGTGAWYLLALWIGGIAGVLVLVAISAMGIFQLRMVDYMQHYGLQRVRLPGGRFERVQPHHSWSIAYRLSNWFYYNAQRHANHHLYASRLYPMLQHSGQDQAPQLPGSYSAMGNLLLFPKRWFKKMDPLVDQWRAQFYPEIENWRSYESAAYRARPESFEAIDLIFTVAPPLEDWINNDPTLLDNLRKREFTDLDLPEGFGPDSEFENLARCGLTRVYWTNELNVAEMQARIAETPARGLRETVEVTCDWSNDKVFQIYMHVLRGNLSPAEAGIALSNIAEASISTLLSVASFDFEQHHPGSTVMVALLGDLARSDAVGKVDVELMLVYEGEHSFTNDDALVRRLVRGLRAFSRDSLLFAQISNDWQPKIIHSLSGYADAHHAQLFSEEVANLVRMRPIFTSGTADIRHLFDKVRTTIMNQYSESDDTFADFAKLATDDETPQALTVSGARDNYRNVQRAACFLQLRHSASLPELLSPDVALVFRTAAEHGLVSAAVADRLQTATMLWKNIIGILQLTHTSDKSIEATSPATKALIASACNASDFDQLIHTIYETATSTASDIRELVT